eukprot:3608283-Heterocapsa_arctica.AAC.1
MLGPKAWQLKLPGRLAPDLIQGLTGPDQEWDVVQHWKEVILRAQGCQELEDLEELGLVGQLLASGAGGPHGILGQGDRLNL